MPFQIMQRKRTDHTILLLPPYGKKKRNKILRNVCNNEIFYFEILLFLATLEILYTVSQALVIKKILNVLKN